MRTRKRFPSFPTIPNSTTSSKEVPSQQEEMKISSFPAPAEGTAREAPQKVLNDWKSIMAEAHRLLGCSSYTSNYRTIWPHVQEEHSSTNPLSTGETVSEIQSTKERNKKSPLEHENSSQTMVFFSDLYSFGSFPYVSISFFCASQVFISWSSLFMRC